jgi:hypothetical protein
LVDAHLARAQREADAELKRRLLIEGYLALLALPTERRQYEAIDWLRVTREGLPSTANSDSYVISQGLQTARDLAAARNDLGRIVQIDRQYWGSVSDKTIESYQFQQLMRANDPAAMSWFVQSEEVGKSSLYLRTDRVERLCRLGHPELARRVALDLADPSLDQIMGPILADLGATQDAEQRADRNMRSRTDQPPSGPAILARIAVIAARRGDWNETVRVVDKLKAAAGVRLFGPYDGVGVHFGYGACDWSLPSGYQTHWMERSVYWQSAAKMTAEPSRPSFDEWPIILGLAGAIAGAEASPRSVELIDQLLVIFKKTMTEAGVDPVNMAILSNGPWEFDTGSARAAARYWLASKQSLLLARVAAGGEIDDEAAEAFSLEWAMTFIASFPRSDLPRRLAALSEAEQQRMRRVNALLLARLRFVSLVLECKATDAAAIARDQPGARHLDGWRLMYPIEALENAGLRDRAAAALGAYAELYPDDDASVVRLLLRVGLNDRAKLVLRRFVAGQSGSLGYSDVFLGVTLLRDLGDRTSPADLGVLNPASNASEAAKRLVDVADALAWDAAADEIATIINRSPPFLAQLPDDEARCIRDTLVGLHAVALARLGDLEGGVRLVSERTLRQREFCARGRLTLCSISAS